MSNCAVCLTSTVLPPSGEECLGDPAPVLTLCGHMFHTYCLKEVRKDDIRCPNCRQPTNLLQLRNVYFEEDTSVAQLLGELHKLKMENVDLKIEKQKINDEKNRLSLDKKVLNRELQKARDEARRREEGPRVLFGMKFDDSSCLNCESKSHTTRFCPSRPIIRNRDNTNENGGKRSNTDYEFQLQMQGAVAGEIATKYEKKFGMEFTREELQVVFAFLFFDSCCWECGSPFHNKDECMNTPAPGIKAVARLMHLENHPLTEEEAEKRHLRFMKYKDTKKDSK